MYMENDMLYVKSKWLPSLQMLKSLFLQNRWADIPETWYVVSETLAHHSLFK